MSNRWTITDEFGNVRLGGDDLPGVFSSLEITQEVEMEETEVKGRSGKAKQITGYADATVNLSLTLTSDDRQTCYEKLAVVQWKFRKTDKAARPDVMKIVNVHCEARGIEQVIFKNLSSSEADGDTISASLEFVEYLPVIPVKKEQRSDRPDPYALPPDYDPGQWSTGSSGGAGSGTGQAKEGRTVPKAETPASDKAPPQPAGRGGA